MDNGVAHLRYGVP
jgi:hypothetical protein